MAELVAHSNLIMTSQSLSKFCSLNDIFYAIQHEYFVEIYTYDTMKMLQIMMTALQEKNKRAAPIPQVHCLKRPLAK